MGAAGLGNGLWPRLAKGIQTEAELQQFFSRRQNPAIGGGRMLQIASAIKVAGRPPASTPSLTPHPANPIHAHLR